mgnify:CR=1 FL=1
MVYHYSCFNASQILYSDELKRKSTGNSDHNVMDVEQIKKTHGLAIGPFICGEIFHTHG